MTSSSKQRVILFLGLLCLTLGMQAAVPAKMIGNPVGWQLFNQTAAPNTAIFQYDQKMKIAIVGIMGSADIPFNYLAGDRYGTDVANRLVDKPQHDPAPEKVTMMAGGMRLSGNCYTFSSWVSEGFIYKVFDLTDNKGNYYEITICCHPSDLTFVNNFIEHNLRLLKVPPYSLADAVKTVDSMEQHIAQNGGINLGNGLIITDVTLDPQKHIYSRTFKFENLSPADFTPQMEASMRDNFLNNFDNEVKTLAMLSMFAREHYELEIKVLDSSGRLQFSIRKQY